MAKGENKTHTAESGEARLLNPRIVLCILSLSEDI